MNTGVRCGGALCTSLPCGPCWAWPFRHHLGVARPGDHGVWRPECIPTERARARAHTQGTASIWPGCLCFCVAVQRAPGVCRGSLCPWAWHPRAATPRVSSGPSQGGVPELRGQPAAGGPLGLPARRWGRRPGLPGGQDPGPVPPLLAESPSPVQELPQGHALVLRQPQLVDNLGEERRKKEERQTPRKSETEGRVSVTRRGSAGWGEILRAPRDHPSTAALGSGILRRSWPLNSNLEARKQCITGSSTERNSTSDSRLNTNVPQNWRWNKKCFWTNKN